MTPSQQSNGVPHSRGRTLGRIVQGVMALAGLGMFLLLVRTLDISELITSGNSFLLLIAIITVLTAVNYSLDTASWWLVCGTKRPSFFSLMSIRARSEALTNTLPGGALIGEPMKIVLLLRTTAMTNAEAATSFLLAKFCIIVGQVLYVVSGVLISYAAINQASERVFGTEHFAALVLGAALLMFVLVVSLLAAMVWFQPMLRWLAPSDRDTRWHRRWNRLVAEAHSIESLVAHAGRTQGKRLALALLCGFTAWALNGVEAFVILHWLDVQATLSQAYAIDAVSCIVRMVIFVLPIGIGGQDWTITGLMSVHGIADPIGTSARLVVLKRAREFFVIGVGLALLMLPARHKDAPEAIEIEPLPGDVHEH